MDLIQTKNGTAIIGTLPGMIGFEPDENTVKTFVVTNEGPTRGGALLIKEPEVQAYLDKQYGEDGYFVLPASVYEVICVPRKGASVEALDALIAQVNGQEECIKEDEILGWHTLEVIDGELVEAVA